MRWYLANINFIIVINSEGSGFEPEYGPVEEYQYRIQPIDRKRLMIALADVDYFLVRGTHGQDVSVVGYERWFCLNYTLNMFSVA